MAFFTALAATAAIASAGYGLYQQQEGRSQAEQGYRLQQQGYQQQQQAAYMQAQISREQAAASVEFAGRERDLNLTAAEQSKAFASSYRDINNQIISYEQQSERQRRQAMELDAGRRQKEVIRNQQRARALALTNATSQGASRGSGLQGGYGQIAGQSGVNLLGIQQNLQIGRTMFDLNELAGNQRIAANDLQYEYQVQQANNQTTKSNIMYDYAVSNAAFQTRQANAGTYMSQGQGLVNQGSGYVSSGQMTSQSGQSYMNMGSSIFNMGLYGSNLFAGQGTTGSNNQAYGTWLSSMGSNGIY